MNIYQKLIEVRKEVPYLQKENQGTQYKYVGSSQVLANCKKKMDELGLLLVPGVVSHKVTESAIEYHDEKTGHVTKRTTTYFTELDMSMTWINAEKPEETISVPWYGQGVDIAGEKGVGKALTYAEKYFMLKFFNIPTDKDDPDAFQAKHEDKPESRPTTTKNDSNPVNFLGDDPFLSETKTPPPKTESFGVLVCSACDTQIDEAVRKWSVDKFGKQLCRKCQAEAKKQSAK